jgi:hypothetical protein
MIDATAIGTNVARSERGAPTLTLRLASFLIGLWIALLASSLTGYLITSRNIFMPFTRFHIRIAPDSDFLPTARQVRALAFATLDKSKVNVVIGGSSVFYGVGQPPGATITDNLRRELGDDYPVINLAMRGSDVSGMAEFTVEMLVREGYKVVYLADTPVAVGPSPIGAAPYQYFFWDAKARGYIIDWPARDAALGKYAWMTDQALGGRLNSLLNFNDLWSTVGYEKVFTVFSILVPDAFWHARRESVDDEPNVPPERRYQYEINGQMAIVRWRISRLPDDSYWEEFRRSFDVAIPAPVRRSMILAICEYSPYYLDRLTQQERDNRRIMRERTMRIVHELVATSVNACDGLGVRDYIDRAHLSVDGAAKIAWPLSEAVRALTVKLGWR